MAKEQVYLPHTDDGLRAHMRNRHGYSAPPYLEGDKLRAEHRWCTTRDDKAGVLDHEHREETSAEN